MKEPCVSGLGKGPVCPAPPPRMLSREGPQPSKGSLRCWGFAHVLLQGVQGAPDSAGPGL